MGEQYFTPSPASAHAPSTVTFECAGRLLRFETDAGVFSREHVDLGTALLIKALPDRLAGRALDLGCGWGAIGVCMAARWPQAHVTLVDINARAVALARANLLANSLEGEALEGDGLTGLVGPFDLIATNPPIRAGKAVVHRLLAQSVERLSPGGALYVVIRKRQGADSAKRALDAMAPTQTVARGGGFHVLRAEKPLA